MMYACGILVKQAEVSARHVLVSKLGRILPKPGCAEKATEVNAPCHEPDGRWGMRTALWTEAMLLRPLSRAYWKAYSATRMLAFLVMTCSQLFTDVDMRQGHK